MTPAHLVVGVLTGWWLHRGEQAFWLVLRLWGISHGLPYVYNADENAHFVPGAIGLFGHGYNPHYFVNPPAYTYLLHAVFAAWFGGREGVSSAYATHPTEVFVVGRYDGRDFATPDDVHRMARPVLRHRLVLTPEAELERYTPESAVRAALDAVPVPR